MDWPREPGESTRLEVVTVYRPTRVVAAVCCFIVALMMIISICPTEWVDTLEATSIAVKDKQGLFRICSASVVEDVPLPVERQGCRGQDKSYMKGVAALIIIGWILMIAAGGLIVYAMLSHLDELKLILYRVALILAAITGVLLLIALITFPVMVGKGLKATLNEASWSVGWAYMLNWASIIVIGLVVALLAVDKNPDETSVRETVIKS